MLAARVEQVGAGCWVWLRLPGSWGETNIGLVVGEGASLLIDTPWDTRLTHEMLAALEPAISAAPVSVLVNTHADPDHWWGNAELPGAEVVASDAAALAMHSEPTPGAFATQKRLAGVSGRLPGRAGLAGRYLQQMFAPFDFASVTLRFPDRVFAGQRTEIVGDREVQLIDLGAAHTHSDTVVLIPDARVVYTGDLLFTSVTPVMWHGPVSAWLAALETIMALPADVFVAGHGPVGTRAELQALHDYWSWLSAEVAEDRHAGRSTIEACRRLIATTEFAAFSGWENPERLYINVATIDRQLQGLGPIPATPIARGRAIDGVARVAEELRVRDPA